MKVSIIIPVYNAEKYLKDCLDSVVNQTLKEIEIICINDESTDCSMKILELYKKNYKNIIIIDQKNKGEATTTNIGISKAKGKYIYILHCDDYIETDAMEICYNEAEKSNLDLLTFDANIVLEEEYVGKIYKSNYYDRTDRLKTDIQTGKEFYIKSVEADAFRAGVWLNFYRSDLVKKNEIYLIPKMGHMDEVYTTQLIISSNKIRYISKKFLNRRLRNGSITSRLPYEFSMGSINGYIKVADEIYKVFLQTEDVYLAKSLAYMINVYIKSAIKKIYENKAYFKLDEIKCLVIKARNIIDITTSMYIYCPMLT